MQPAGGLRVSAGRLRRGGGIVGGGWYSQVRAPSEPQFGALREVAACERQGALSRRAWQRPIEWVHTYTRFGEVGGQLDRRRARGVLNPCAPESRRESGDFLRKKLTSDHGLFSYYEGQQKAANGQDS